MMTDLTNNVWGWLVPANHSQPQMSVRPLSLVSGEVFCAGRESTCSLVFQDWMFQGFPGYFVDQTLRLHFEIFRKDQETFIVNKSCNMTFAQGVNLVKDKPRVLKHGDSIAILCNDIELFWYLEEDTLIDRNYFSPQIFTKYLVANEVGWGSFGVVKKGFVRGSYQPVAMKFLPKSRIELFNSEVEILKQLVHPCVTRLKDVVSDERNFVIVMEFAEGGELEHQVVLDRTMERLSERTAKIQFYQICHAVAYLHSKKVCHRDLKLSNILMSCPNNAKSKLKIADFGLSKLFSTSPLRSHVGAPIIMAPEVMDNFERKTYTNKADLWSLGICLFQLLVGKLPNDASNIRMEGGRWEDISCEAKDLIDSLLTVDPVRRLSADQALQHVWFQGDEEVCREARHIMDSLSLEEASQYQPLADPQQDSGVQAEAKAEAVDIRSRLRPRNPVNYNKVIIHNSPHTVNQRKKRKA